MAAVAVWLAVAMVDREEPPLPGEPAPGAPGEAAATDTTPAPPRPVTGAAAEGVVDRVAQMRVAARRYEDECAARLEPAAGEGTAAIVADCVRRLAAALDALVATDTVGRVDLDRRLETFRAYVAHLQDLPPGSARAGPTRDVMTSAAEVITTVRRRRFAESVDVDGAERALRQAAESIRSDRTLATQQPVVREFFLRTGELLGAMARPGDPGPGAI